MSEREIKLEFYVLNHNFNTNKIEYYNIFNNFKVYESTVKEVKKYLRAPSKYKYTKFFHFPDDEETVLYGFEGFCEELRHIIMWEEWSRCEYEIAVGGLFEQDANKFEKWDCYQQALPNIKVIAREVIYQAREFYKNKVNKANKSVQEDQS